jgi:hypothetical protein
MFSFFKSLYHQFLLHSFDLPVLTHFVNTTVEYDDQGLPTNRFEGRLQLLLLNQLLFLDPKQAKLHYLLSIHYLGQKQLKRSLMHAKMAYSIAPFEIVYRENWINGLLRNRAYHLSRIEVEKLQQLYTNEPKYQKVLLEINARIAEIDRR